MMDEKKQQEANLEEILKEFSQVSDEDTQLEDTEQAQELAAFLEENSLEEGAGDALRQELSNLQHKVAELGDTIRLDTIAAVVGSNEADKEPAPEPQETEVPPAPAEEKAEPYSDQWEPEYEQPIGEYIPPQPIQFHPRSRLRELKRKLIAGPEKRYYELSELGLGKMQLGIFCSLLVVLLSSGATALYAAGLVGEHRMKLMVFSQFFAILLSAFLGRHQILSGISDLFHLRFSLNSTLVFTLAACCMDGLFCLRELRVPCCAAFCLQVLMAQWAAYHRRHTEMGQMDTLRRATHLDSLVPEDAYYDNCRGLLRGEGQVEDFMDTYMQRTAMEKTLSVYGLVALLVSIASGITAGILHSSPSFGVQVLAVSLLAAIPATAFISQTRPMAILQRRLHAVGAVLCGWQGIKAMCGRVAFPLDHEDLFPAGSCQLNGVKFYGSRDPDAVVAYTTALVNAGGGGLVPLFDYLLDSRNGRHYHAEMVHHYHGGLGGEVMGESVLVGTSDFLKTMGVEIPQGTRVNQAVYAAIDGELCGLFAISYAKDKATAAGLGTLCGYRRLYPTLISNDFLLTESFLRSRFSINTRRMAFPERQVRQSLAEKAADPQRRAAALITGTGLAPFAYAVSGARMMRIAGVLGVVVHMLGGIVGLLMMLALAVLGVTWLLTPENMLLYTLVWMVPGLLFTEWTRSI